MPDLTFTTEAERLAAREQYVAVRMRMFGDVNGEIFEGERFDHTFPPIRPPKMKPQVRWVLVQNERPIGPSIGYATREEASKDVWRGNYRLARVRITELDEGEEV